MGYVLSNTTGTAVYATQYGVTYEVAPGGKVEVYDPRVALNLDAYWPLSMTADARRRAKEDNKHGIGHGATGPVEGTGSAEADELRAELERARAELAELQAAVVELKAAPPAEVLELGDAGKTPAKKG